MLRLQRVKHHGHTVVNPSQQGIRQGRYDRKGVEHLAVDISPRIPKTSKRERLFFLQVRPDRNFAVSFSAPFIKAAKSLIARFLSYCLGAASIMLLPMVGSGDHDGTNPHFMAFSSLMPLF